MSAALNLNHSDYKKDDQTLAQVLKMKPKASRRILVIDDDIDTAESIKYIAESYEESISCHVVSDPYEALICLSDYEFDFVLIDQKIPGLDGTSILSKVDEYIDQDPLIVESGRYINSIPTVLMSGSDVHLPNGFKLKNFKLEKIINKKDLPKFLAQSFAN